MTKRFNTLTLKLLALLFLISPVWVNAQALPNLSVVKQQLIQYHDSGQYMKDIEAMTTQAMTYVQQRVAENNALAQPKKLAMVFDIDETVLSNYPDMFNMNFGGTFKAIIEAEEKAHDPAIAPTLALYQYAQKNNIAIFFVTGRKEALRQPTIKNLQRTGLGIWNTLFMKPNNYAQASVVPYKSGARAKIQSMGYDIILNIGDQDSDLAGGYADKDIKLPNPYYLIP
jgi:5'-nucleotidase (lipoprotein e(P4) family)